MCYTFFVLPHVRSLSYFRNGYCLKLLTALRENWKLFVVKPVLIFYALQWSITGSVNGQVNKLKASFFVSIKKENRTFGDTFTRQKCNTTTQQHLRNFIIL